MSRNLFRALVASVVVAIPFAFISITIASGNLSDILMHPGFWGLYAKNFIWIFLVGFLASALTVVLVSKKQGPA